VDTLVLLPGLDGTGTLYDDFVSELPSTLGINICRYPTHQFLSYSELIPYVSNAVPSNGVFLLVAESYSTPLAVKFAAAHPANLAGLVMCSGFIGNPVGNWSFLAGVLTNFPLFRFSPPSWALERFLIGTSPSDALEVRVRQAIRLVDPRILSRRIRAVLNCDVGADLSLTEIPLLYIQAEGDRLVSPKCFREIQRVRPDAVLARIPAPHLVIQREPRRSAQAIVRFMDDLS
jgi:pimeloyl-[acyl-carrier protein] methyl ester esterase